MNMKFQQLSNRYVDACDEANSTFKELLLSYEIQNANCDFQTLLDYPNFLGSLCRFQAGSGFLAGHTDLLVCGGHKTHVLCGTKRLRAEGVDRQQKQPKTNIKAKDIAELSSSYRDDMDSKGGDDENENLWSKMDTQSDVSVRTKSHRRTQVNTFLKLGTLVRSNKHDEACILSCIHPCGCLELFQPPAAYNCSGGSP